MLKLTLAEDVVRRLDIMDVAREIADWRQEDMVNDFDSDATKEAWAQKFEAAAALIRGGKEKA
jgi:hypothetical protein